MGEPSAEQLHILVVDDDEGMRKLLADIITRRGHQVIPAASAEEGLELLPYWTFHIAFLDHNLPGMEGLLLGAYLRRSNPDMTIALVTGEEDPRLERRTRDLAITFIRKPFDVGDIGGVIDRYLQAAQDREERRLRREDPDFEPPIARHILELADCYGIPSVPDRITDRLVQNIKRCMSNLRTASRYTERDRVIALAGLLTARVLGVELPKHDADRTLYEEYDRIMRERGRRTEFE